MKIEDGVEIGTELVHNWVANYDITGNHLQFSWGSKKEFITSDPYDMVKVRGGKIIIKELDVSDESWVYEYVRGLLYVHWPFTDDQDPKLDLDRKWDFTRLISVVLTPPSIIPERVRRKYVYEWGKQIHLPNNFERKLDLHRIYQTLRLHSRNKTLELLGNFLYKGYNPNASKPFISQFHFSLFEHLNHPYDYDQIDLITKGLDTQDLRIKTLASLLPQYSTTKIFSLWKQVETHLSTFIFPCRRVLGSYKFFIFNGTQIQVEGLKDFPFFESIEEFEDERGNFVKARITSNSVIGLFENITSFSSNLQFMIVLPDSSFFRISPEMFNPESKSYYSVQNVKSKVLHIQEDQKIPIVEPKSILDDEMRVLMNLLKLQDDNPVNNFGDFSQDKTKKLILSLKEKSAYYPLVLIRKSSLLRTGVIRIPLSEYSDLKDFKLTIEDLEDPVKLHNLMGHIPVEKLDMKLLVELKQFSWPYMTVDFGILIEPSEPNRIQVVAMVRISCNKDDIQLISSKNNVIYFGIQFYNQGTAPIIPLSCYQNDKWVYPLDELTKLLE